MTDLQDMSRTELENEARILFLAAERSSSAVSCVRFDRRLWDVGLQLWNGRRPQAIRKAARP